MHHIDGFINRIKTTESNLGYDIIQPINHLSLHREQKKAFLAGSKVSNDCDVVFPHPLAAHLMGSE